MGQEAARGDGGSRYSAGGQVEKDAWEVKSARLSGGFDLKSDRGEGKCQPCFLSG